MTLRSLARIPYVVSLVAKYRTHWKHQISFGEKLKRNTSTVLYRLYSSSTTVQQSKVLYSEVDCIRGEIHLLFSHNTTLSCATPSSMAPSITSVRRKTQNQNHVDSSGSSGSSKASIFWCLISFLMGVAVTSMSYQRSTMSGMTTSSTGRVDDCQENDDDDDNASDGHDVKSETRPTDLSVYNDLKSTTTQVVTAKNFEEIGIKTGTDKVVGSKYLPACLANGSCIRKECEREECRPWGHWYHTMYQGQGWISDYALPTAEPFQFLEIGFHTGKGYETYYQFFADAPKAELHSMEISCIEPGPRSEGKWPVEWGNTASQSPRYQELLDAERLHCGDASDLTFLDNIWRNKMRRPDAPPLRIVVDDASHLSSHMVTSVFFWFPRIEPGGLLIVEDIQPINEANRFRTQFLPQVRHFCCPINYVDLSLVFFFFNEVLISEPYPHDANRFLSPINNTQTDHERFALLW